LKVFKNNSFVQLDFIRALKEEEYNNPFVSGQLAYADSTCYKERNKRPRERKGMWTHQQ
jgi:hypothetical protein